MHFEPLRWVVHNTGRNW